MTWGQKHEEMEALGWFALLFKTRSVWTPQSRMVLKARLVELFRSMTPQERSLSGPGGALNPQQRRTDRP